MADFGLKLRPDILTTEDDPLASVWVRYLASIAMTVVATVVAVGVDSKVTIPNLSLVFVIPVIIAGVSLGFGPSLCSAILGALAYNFFLTEPRYSLAVDDPANIWAIGLLFVVGLITSGAAFISDHRATEAALLRRQASVLQGYCRDIIETDNVEAILSTTSHALAELFRAPSVVMLFNLDRIVSIKKDGDLGLQEAELNAARSSLETGITHSGVYPNSTSRFDFCPIQTAEGQRAVIGLALDPDERPSDPGTPVAIVASVLTLVLDRQYGRDKAIQH